MDHFFNEHQAARYRPKVGNCGYLVGWMLAAGESAVLAEKLIAGPSAKQGISRGQLTLHADLGSSMTSKPVALLHADLGVTQSHSRPHSSNDCPFSEAVRALKYRPDFPKKFGSIEAARAYCQRLFAWYNGVHRHRGLGLLAGHRAIAG